MSVASLNLFAASSSDNGATFGVREAVRGEIAGHAAAGS